MTVALSVIFWMIVSWMILYVRQVTALCLDLVGVVGFQIGCGKLQHVPDEDFRYS